MGRKSIKDLTTTILQMGNGHFITKMVQYTKSKNTNFKYLNYILKSKSHNRGVFVCRRLGLGGCNITFHLTKLTKMIEIQYNTPIKRTIKQKYSKVSSLGCFLYKLTKGNKNEMIFFIIINYCSFTIWL